VFLAIAVLTVSGQVAQASDALSFWKNYFVTGDYVAAGVGLRSTGGADGFATGTINMNGVPCTGGFPVGYISCDKQGAVPADVVAAFLYWETEETTTNPSAFNGFFDGNKIVGKPVGNANNPACWSSGGTSGSAIGAGRSYRADVLRYLPFDPAGNNVRIANGSHTVRLPDSGGTGNGNILLTDGATLVVIYRVVIPGQPQFAPLRAIVAYDGSYTLSKGSAPMTQTIGGYYQASSNASAHMTQIVGNGQPGFVETLRVNGAALPGIPFTGTAGATGARWDNPTFPIGLAKDSSSYSTQVTANSNQVCLTFTSIWTSTNVTDTDNDGLLDTWEMNGLHLNPGTSTLLATFGGCADFPNEDCVNLPAMGANPGIPDIFAEIDWEQGTDGHQHIPKYEALSAVAQTFANHRDVRFPNGIALHFDVGNNYQGKPYIVPTAYAQGGEVVDERLLLCPNQATKECTYSKNYAVQSFKRGFRAVKDGFPLLGIGPHFAHNRKDIFHYVLFAHALAGPFDPATGMKIGADPKSISGVADRPGGDVMITLGLWRYDDAQNDQIGSALVQAGTLMHELGHNLDLSHAGLYRSPNCLPNYPSVMNYQYQTRGLTDANGFEHVDYSNGALPDLNENSLSETQSMGPLQYRVRYYGPVPTRAGAAQAHCDGTPITDGALFARLETPGLSTPDWNNDGKIDGPWALDTNFNGVVGDGVNVAAGKYFVDSNDWANLNLQQVGARLNVNGLSTDVGSLDLGSLDLGSLDLGSQGSLDLGSLDLGSLDLGSLDLGSLDLGSLDLGDVDYDTVISSMDATSSDQPLAAAVNINPNRITLTWGAPSIGQIRHYNIYRSDPAHTVPILLNHIDGAPPVPTYDDIVNDFNDAGAGCDNQATCYNTNYTYYVTSVDTNGTESTPSSTASAQVTHFFVIADNQNLVYGDPLNGATGKVYGDATGSMIANCAYTISPAVPRNAGTYSITCSNLTGVPPNVGVSYNVSYNDGVLHSPGSLTIAPRPLTVTAVGSSKVYDGGTTSTSIPALAPATLYYNDQPAFTEAYDNKNVGTTHVMTPSGGVSDGNNGQNYIVTPVNFVGGIITKANPVISVTGYTVTYDGSQHFATGTATGVQNETLSGLDLSGTAHTNAADYPNDQWVFTDSTGNYFNAAGVVHDKINPAPQTITFLPLSDRIAGNPPFPVSAVASSGLPVIFTSSSLANCSVSGNMVTLLATGTCSITASQPGGGNYLPALPVMQSFHVAGFAATGSMTTPRSFHTATLLAGGKVLVTGGFSSSGAPLASAELYNPSSGTFSATSNNMPNKAAGHTATVLSNGKVLVVGGGNASSQIYDPVANSWSSAGGIGGQRTYHTATWLSGIGKVLIVGGSDNSGKTTNTALLYDPVTGSYTSTGNMTVSRDFHTATLLGNGKVLIAGGRTGTGSSYTYLATAELYDPATGVFSPAGSMLSLRYGHTATILSDGTILFAGGANPGAITASDLYDPSTGMFSAAGSMSTGRQYSTATVFGNLGVIEAGGQNGTSLASAEQYQNGTFQAAGNMTSVRAAHTATVLNDGSILFTGGRGGNGTSIGTAELLK
jgi:hypothetical protein